MPRSLSSITLYGNNNKLRLPLKSLEEEFKGDLGEGSDALQGVERPKRG